LPPGVAFMTLANHTGRITALDFTEPYGTLVSAATDDSVRVWDLCSGEEVGRLRGHKGAVKTIQTDEQLCLTAGADGDIRLWDLRLVDDYEGLVEGGPCVKTLEGHSKAVSSLYYEDGCLVRL
jgi:division protein 1